MDFGQVAFLQPDPQLIYLGCCSLNCTFKGKNPPQNTMYMVIPMIINSSIFVNMNQIHEQLCRKAWIQRIKTYLYCHKGTLSGAASLLIKMCGFFEYVLSHTQKLGILPCHVSTHNKSRIYLATPQSVNRHYLHPLLGYHCIISLSIIQQQPRVFVCIHLRYLVCSIGNIGKRLLYCAHRGVISSGCEHFTVTTCVFYLPAIINTL